jgi:hypothetical protein
MERIGSAAGPTEKPPEGYFRFFRFIATISS